MTDSPPDRFAARPIRRPTDSPPDQIPVCPTDHAMDLGEPIFDVVHHNGKRQQQQPNRSKRLKEAAQMPQTCVP
jgi:hypothetical protein